MKFRDLTSAHILEAQMGDLASPQDSMWLARRFVEVFGFGNILFLGPPESSLIPALRDQSLDVRVEDPFKHKHDFLSFLSNQKTNQFHTIILAHSIEHMGRNNIQEIITECSRITIGQVYAIICSNASGLRHENRVEGNRNFWEESFLSAGFRKHPILLSLNSYELTDWGFLPLHLGFEKIPLKNHKTLANQQSTSKDFLLENSAMSDAQMAKYIWASSFLKEGDTVIDIGCTTGYGIWIMYRRGRASHLLGFDEDKSAIDYANSSYARPAYVEFIQTNLIEKLSSIETGSVDLITFFDQFHKTDQPTELLAELRRVLKPGGRLCLSVPNIDFAQNHPKCKNIHGKSYDATRALLSNYLDLEQACGLTAHSPSHKKRSRKKLRSRKSIRFFDPNQTLHGRHPEWWLVSAVRNPNGLDIPYVEKMYENISDPKFINIEYDSLYNNPWMALAVTNSGSRVRNNEVLHAWICEAEQEPRVSLAEQAAYLCVKSYRILETKSEPRICAQAAQKCADLAKQLDETKPHDLRWKVSLYFSAGKLVQKAGDANAAIVFYKACAALEASNFAVHLNTKTCEALYLAGALALSQGKVDLAENLWERGVNRADVLCQATKNDILINPDKPNFFHYGDGVREYALAWDSLAKCANGIRMLRDGRGKEIWELNAIMIKNSMINELEGRDTHIAFHRNNNMQAILRRITKHYRQRLTFKLPDIRQKTRPFSRKIEKRIKSFLTNLDLRKPK